jgi:hypothetical protein
MGLAENGRRSARPGAPRQSFFPAKLCGSDTAWCGRTGLQVVLKALAPELTQRSNVGGDVIGLDAS